MGFHWIRSRGWSVSLQSLNRAHQDLTWEASNQKGATAASQLVARLAHVVRLVLRPRFRNPKILSVLICLHLEMCHVSFSALLVIAPNFLRVNPNSPDGSHCLIRAAATNDQRYEGMGENKVCWASPGPDGFCLVFGRMSISLFQGPCSLASPLPAWKRLKPFTQPCSWVQRFPRLSPRRQNPWFTWNGTAAKFDKVWLGVKDICESVAATWFRMVSQHAPMACGDNNLWNHIWFQPRKTCDSRPLRQTKWLKGNSKSLKVCSA